MHTYISDNYKIFITQSMTQLKFNKTPYIQDCVDSMIKHSHDNNDNDTIQQINEQPYVTIENIQYISQCMLKYNNNDNSNTNKPPYGYIHELLRHTTYYQQPIQPTKRKSAEFERYLQQQRIKLDRLEYETMINNSISKKQQHKIGNVGQSFAEISKDISIGINVILMMITGFMVALFIGRQLFVDNVTMQVLCGTVGLIIALLVEVILFIIRDKTKDEHIKKLEQRKLKQQGIINNHNNVT